MTDASNSVLAMTLIALAVGLAFIAGCALHYGREITARSVPMQWGLDGRPGWFAPRLVGLWFSFGFTAILSTGLLAIAHHEPQRLVALVLATAIVTGANMWMQVYHLKRVIRWQAEAPAN